MNEQTNNNKNIIVEKKRREKNENSLEIGGKKLSSPNIFFKT